MADNLSFRELIGRVRQGDDRAASELVRRYEPAIRRAVRFRLTDARLRRTCDSMDVCQSVLLSFFVRAASGQYDLDTPEQLLHLLTTMARNKLLNQARQEHAARRDNRIVSDVADQELISTTPGPAQEVEARELLEEVHARLTPEERRLVELRNQGCDWASIAKQLGGSPAALRQKLHRALARLSRQFGLEEADEWPLPLVEVLLRQREAWQAGRSPAVEDFLRDHPHLAAEADAVLDLVYNETVLREERGRPGTLDEYLAPLPHLAAELRLQFEVDQAMTADELSSPGVALHGSTTPVSSSEPSGATALPRLQGCDLLDELGRGAMGVVYRGWQRGAKRLVAVKLLAADVPVGRIGNEAAAASRLQHPHIVQVFEVSEYQGRTALVLEYVEGGCLAQKLASKPQPPRDAARLVETLAWAMAYAHGRGVVHRDLKPSNVLLSAGPDAPLAQCIPKIGDFGLAKLVEGGPYLTRTTDVLGTPSYMAPEQTGGGQAAVGPTADVYSLRAILYQCLTGRPPFLGQSVLDTLDQVRHQDPVPPSHLQPRTPRDLETICLKCLHKAPARRYASARDLAEDLQRFQRYEPIKARAVGPVERVQKWARRRPAAAALILVSVAASLLLLTGGLSFSQVWRRQRDVARRQANELDAQLRRTRRLLYTTQLLRVGSVWESDPTQRCACSKTPWRVPPTSAALAGASCMAQCQRYRRSLLYRAVPTAVACSPDGALLAVGDEAGRITLVNAAGEEVASFHEHTARVAETAFSPDGELLASAGHDGKVYLWDVPHRKKLGSLTPPGGRAAGVAFHPDRRTLAVNSGPVKGRGAATLWDVRTLRLRRTLRGDTSPLCGVAVSPDGSTVACADREHVVRLWAARTGQQAPGLRGHSAPVTRIVFAPHSQSLATGSLDGMVRLWDLSRSAETDAFAAGLGPVTALAFHERGQTLAIAGEGSGAAGGESAADVRFWDVLARRGSEPLRGHPGGATGAAFSQDGQTLATAGADRTVKLWDYPGQREEVVLRGHTGAPGTVSLARDGKTLAWVSRGNQPGGAGVQLAVFDLERGAYRVLRGHGRPIRCLAISPDGSTLASAAAAGPDEPAELLVWQAGSGQLLQALSGHAVEVTALAFSPDGKRLASAGWDGAVKVWDLDAGKARLALQASARPARAAAFSGDGKRLAVGGGEGQASALDVWDVDSGALQRTLPAAGGLDCLAITSDGALAAYAGKGGLVHLVEVETGEVRPPLAMGMKGVACIAFSPDAQTLAVAGAGAGVKLWDVPTAQERASLPRHRGGACFVEFTTDGALLVSASATGMARLWRSAGR